MKFTFYFNCDCVTMKFYFFLHWTLEHLVYLKVCLFFPTIIWSNKSYTVPLQSFHYLYSIASLRNWSLVLCCLLHSLPLLSYSVLLNINILNNCTKSTTFFSAVFWTFVMYELHKCFGKKKSVLFNYASNLTNFFLYGC